LANRQRVLEQNNGLGQTDMNKNGNATNDNNVIGNGGGLTTGVRYFLVNLRLAVLVASLRLEITNQHIKK